MTATEEISKAIESVVRPIVEGQIRGFIKEHPSILQGVNWYKPRLDKAPTLVNSLSKRIVRDLTCGTTAARLVDALLANVPDVHPNSSVEGFTADEGDQLGSFSELVALPDAVAAGIYRPDSFEIASYFAEAA